MAYDEYLAERVHHQLEQSKVDFYAKKMFGGLCFMVDEKMCIGIRENMIMARIDPEEEELLKGMDGVNDMDFTGRPMKGYIYVSPEAIDEEKDLAFFIDKCLAYNPKAKMSKKRSSKT